MTDPAQNKGQMAAEETGTCSVPMRDGRLCGRPVLGHATVNGVPYCLMHYGGGMDEAAFQKEFARILSEAGTGLADFSGFAFPNANYAGRVFHPHCVFSGAKFTQNADFSGVRFARGANFNKTTFTRRAEFAGARFTKVADFGLAAFAQGASFSGATFIEAARFSEATFAQMAHFVGTTFDKSATFFAAAFDHDAAFVKATFTQDAHFSGATFTQGANFGHATFTQDASFREATFAKEVGFTKTAFLKGAHFERAKFLGAAEFRETTFRQDGGLSPGPVFTLAEFSRPEAVVFYRTYLGQALFHNCDVSKLNFSSVGWRRRRKGRKRMVFEETVSLEDNAAEALKPEKGNPDERYYGLIAELYQQLKKNYDERKDYWRAGDFHYGEMEMKRMHSWGKSGLARWFHRNLGVVAWYKRASQYGESYVRPAVVLSIVLAIFTLLFPLAGLNRNEDALHSAASTHQQTPDPLSRLSYGHFNDFVGAYSGRLVGTAAFFGNSLMTVLSVAGFQRELKYEPSYPWGRALALWELLLTSTLIALFLLAVRRQFRR